MWEEVENRKTNKARVAEVGRKRREREEETNNRGGENDSKNSGRKGE